MRSSYIVAAILATAYMVVVVLATVGLSTSAQAGMRQDLTSCTAAEGRASVAACTRVMKSGRLPREQFYIGYFNRGSGYRRAGDFAKALADFKRVVKLKPKFARGYHMRGLVQADLGAREKALADLGRAISLNAREWSTYYTRASLLRADKDYDRALADLNTAAELKPGKTKVRLLRALIVADKGDYAEARAEINKVISEGNNPATAYYARAAVAFAEKRLDAADKDVALALSHHDAFPAAYVLEGRIQEAKGNRNAATKRYREALKLPVHNMGARGARAFAEARLKALGETADVALNQRSPEVGCKRFLPATGTIINSDCDE